MSLSDWVNTNKRPLQRTPSIIAAARLAFLEALREGASVNKAAKAAGAGRMTVYQWRDADLEFRAAWEAAFEAGTDKLEDEAYRRAHDGVEKPVISQGQFGKEDDYAYRQRLLDHGGNDSKLAAKLISIAGNNLDVLGYEVGVPRAILHVREHSDTMMCLMLKARRPDVYRERTTTIVTGPNGGPIQSFHVVVDPIEAARTYQSIMDDK